MSADRSRYRCISAADAVALIRSKPGVALFDVRDLASYQRGHIDGAAHLTEDRFLTWTRRLDKATPVLIY
ncbi:rhodanese-like domain-containing protein, partial [Zoogloea sp.]|uniref:rhodanese-like domain-containing protein n=1 Tax=Zoogloea sp. TaxID=49181 RepID=UPI002CA0361A